MPEFMMLETWDCRATQDKIGSIKLNEDLLARLLVLGGSRDVIGRNQNNKSEVLS